MSFSNLIVHTPAAKATASISASTINVAPAYAGAPALMSSFRAYSGLWKCFGTALMSSFGGKIPNFRFQKLK